MHNSESPKGLQIGIVGAGVAGLAAAIALRRVGHECEVSKRFPLTRTTLTRNRFTRDLSSETKMVQLSPFLPTAEGF